MKKHVLILSQPKCGSTAIFYRIKNAMPSLAADFFEPGSLLEIRKEFLSSSSAVAKILLPPWTDEFEPGAFLDLPDNVKIVCLHRDPRDFMVSAYLYSFFESFSAREPLRAAQVLNLLQAKERLLDGLNFRHMIGVKNALERGDHIAENFLPIPLPLDRFGGNEIDMRPHPFKLSAMTPMALAEQTAIKGIETEGFVNFIRRTLKSMLEVREFAEKRNKAVFWLSYEDLVQNRLSDLERYLEVGLPDDTSVGDEHKRVVRTKSFGDWVNWLSEDDIGFFRDIFQEYMTIFGYGDAWQRPNAPHIAPAVASEYVAKLLINRLRAHGVTTTPEALTTIDGFLKSNDPRTEGLVAPLEPTRTETEGTGEAEIDDVHIETENGERVNVLIPSHRYVYCYNVQVHKRCSGVAFWMQITNPNGREIVNGNSFRGGRKLDVAEAGSRFQVRFPFLCELRRGHYFCNAGITHEDSGRTEILQRRLKAAVILVRKVFYELSPEIRVEGS